MNIDERHVCARCLSPVTEGTRCELCGFLESEYAPEPHHLPPETLLQRRYLVASVLGEGGFGVTYAAWDLTLDRAVAVKEYFSALHRRARLRQDLRRQPAFGRIE